MPIPLDEYPVHQAPLSMRYVDTGDRNAYDRCIMQCFRRDAGVQLITGLGVYPNLGVIDAFAVVRIGDRQVAVRTSDALSDDRLAQQVGPYRIEVLEPLRRIRAVCEAEEHGIAFDLTFTGATPPQDEPRHIMRSGDKLLLDGCRFVQTGTWTGTLWVEGQEHAVDEVAWSGTRDRSWGVRPSGESEPAGRFAEEAPTDGFWWLWVPLRFDEFSLVVIAQEEPDGTRILNEAVRFWPEGAGRRPEQLGWPEVDITYRPGTRHPERAVIHLVDRRRQPVTVEVETLGFVPLMVGAGYGGDPDWGHGQWRGRGWVEGAAYDLAAPDVAGRIAFSVNDHVARATCDGAEGWGIFEHASMGRHDPTGMADWSAVAP